MSNFPFGFHIGVMNGPILSIAKELGFEGNSILEGLVVSIFIAGAFLGCAGAGYVVDKLGFRRTFQVDTLPLILGAILRYRIIATITDATSSMPVVMFDETVSTLAAKSCQEIILKDGCKDRKTILPQMTSQIGKLKKFTLKMQQDRSQSETRFATKKLRAYTLFWTPQQQILRNHYQPQHSEPTRKENLNSRTLRMQYKTQAFPGHR